MRYAATSAPCARLLAAYTYATQDTTRERARQRLLFECFRQRHTLPPWRHYAIDAMPLLRSAAIASAPPAAATRSIAVATLCQRLPRAMLRVDMLLRRSADVFMKDMLLYTRICCWFISELLMHTLRYAAFLCRYCCRCFTPHDISLFSIDANADVTIASAALYMPMAMIYILLLERHCHARLLFLPCHAKSRFRCL